MLHLGASAGTCAIRRTARVHALPERREREEEREREEAVEDRAAEMMATDAEEARDRTSPVPGPGPGPRPGPGPGPGASGSFYFWEPYFGKIKNQKN